MPGVLPYAEQKVTALIVPVIQMAPDLARLGVGAPTPHLIVPQCEIRFDQHLRRQTLPPQITRINLRVYRENTFHQQLEEHKESPSLVQISDVGFGESTVSTLPGNRNIIT